jgi:hypothetical protein
MHAPFCAGEPTDSGTHAACLLVWWATLAEMTLVPRVGSACGLKKDQRCIKGQNRIELNEISRGWAHSQIADRIGVGLGSDPDPLSGLITGLSFRYITTQFL